MLARTNSRRLRLLLLLTAVPLIAHAQGVPDGGTIARKSDKAGGQTKATDRRTAQAAPSKKATPVQSGPEEVTVTGTSRRMRLQNAPVAVTAFTARDIERAGISGPQGFLRLTPNVSLDDSMQSEAEISIRGIAQTGKLGASSPVAVVIDGVPIMDPSEFVQDLYNIQQIEVLKGPQGALYGRNAIAGAIVIQTQPPPSEWGGNVTIGGSNGDGYKAKLVVGGPLIPDVVRVQLLLSDNHLDGLYTDVTTDKKVDFYDSKTISGDVLITPIENLTIDLKAGGTSGQNGSFQYLGLTSGNPFYGKSVINVNDTNVPYPEDLTGVYREQRNNFSGRMTYDLGWATLTSTTGRNFIKWQSQGSEFPYTPVAPGETEATQHQSDGTAAFFQELRLTSDSHERLRYMIGADFYDYTQRIVGLTGTTNDETIYPADGPFPAGSSNPTTSFSKEVDRTKAYGVFGDLSYDILPGLTADIAVRYDRTDITSLNEAPLAFSNTSGQTRDANYSQVQPKYTLSYKLTPDIMLFADYGRGFLSGGFNAAGSRAIILASGDTNSSVQDIYPEETTDSYETGFKSQWLNDRLTVNGTLFYQSIHNQQVFAFIPSADLQVIDSINRVRSFGGELEADYRLRGGWDVQAAAGITHATIMEYKSDPSDVGNRAPNVPEYNTSFAVSKNFQLTEHLSGFARIEDVLKGTQYWEAANLPGYRTNAFNLVNVRVSVSKGPWTLVGFANNITDERYTANVVPIGSTAAAIFLGQPRLVGLNLSRSF